MRRKRAILFAALAAALYAVNIPVSKLLLAHIGSVMMAALLYLGAGIGMAVFLLAQRAGGPAHREQGLSRKDMPSTVGMVVLDIAAPVLMMLGLRTASASSAALLSNFEIVATSVIAFFAFKEVISKRLWAAVFLICAASIVLTLDDVQTLSVSPGALLILAATVCWGFENNCTRKISAKNPIEIVTIKGLFSGAGAMVVAFCAGERLPEFRYILAALVLGFFAYGLSICFYIWAQRELGAAKTSAYYAVNPFLGVVFSFILFRDLPGVHFYAALAIMAVGTFLAVRDNIALQHVHVHTHTHCHIHSHGAMVHEHMHTHTHAHVHVHTDEDGACHDHVHSREPEHRHCH